MGKRRDGRKQAIVKTLLVGTSVEATTAVIVLAGGAAYAGQNSNGSITVSPGPQRPCGTGTHRMAAVHRTRLVIADATLACRTFPEVPRRPP
jgi:hypothetical protein